MSNDSELSVSPQLTAFKTIAENFTPPGYTRNIIMNISLEEHKKVVEGLSQQLLLQHRYETQLRERIAKQEELLTELRNSEARLTVMLHQSDEQLYKILNTKTPKQLKEAVKYVKSLRD